MPLRSMDSTTASGVKKSGSETRLALIGTEPENDTVSGDPMTEPETLPVAALDSVATTAEAGGGPPPHTSPPAITAEAETAADIHNDRLVLICRSSQCGRQDVGGRTEGHALGRRYRRRQRPQERRAVVVDLPAQEHGIVLVHRVVTVLHEHPAPVPELHRD